MKKRFSSMVAVAAVLMACTTSAQVVVRIGVAAPLTGPQAHLGLDVANGVRMAVDDVNAKSLRIGGQDVRFQAVVEDDQADPRQATAVAQRFADSRINGVVGHFNSGATIPAARVYSEAGIAQISPSSTNPRYTQQGYKTAFRTMGNDINQGAVLGRAIVKLGKKVAIIDDRTAYGQGLADETEKAIKAAGGQVLGREFTSDKSTDFAAIVTRIKGMKPDAVFFAGTDPQGGPLLRQMRGLGVNALFIAGDGCQTSGLIRLAGEAAEGVYATSSGQPLNSMPQGKTFESRFKDKYKTDIQKYAPYAYDAANALVAAMTAAQSIDPSRYLPHLASVSFDGVTGRIAFDEKGDIRDAPISLYQVRSGAWEPIATYRGPEEVK